VETLAPGLFRISAGGMAAVHVVMSDPPTLVDAGAPGRGPAIERELRNAGIAVGRIAFTHGDPDHVGGSNHLRRAMGAEVWAPAAERPMIERTAWPTLPRRRRALMRFFFRGAPPPSVDRWFDGGDDLGGLAVIATPGHSPGHVCFQWRDWLLAGDALVTGNRFRESPSIFTLDQMTARRSIEALAERRPGSASSSHGRPVDRATERLEALVSSWR